MTTQIKQLDWDYSPFNGGEEWITHPIPSHLKYVIVKYTSEEYYRLYINSDYRKQADNFNEAKHLAQADFETKIEGCLTHDPS